MNRGDGSLLAPSKLPHSWAEYFDPTGDKKIPMRKAKKQAGELKECKKAGTKKAQQGLIS
jgi:hypothetical protein